jgi:hypothetical protein
MKYLVPFLLLASTLMGQDEPAPRALISSDFIASVESLGTRLAQTNITVVYLDTVPDDQFVPVASVRADVTQFIRNTGATAAPEACAKAIAKGLVEKYPQIAGMTLTVYTSFDNSGSPGYVSTLTRLAPNLTPAAKTAVTQKLDQEAARARNAQVRNDPSRIVR